MKNPYQFTYIEWSDSISNDEAWVDIESATTWAGYDGGIIKQVGFIINETKDYLLLVSRICDHENKDDRMVRGLVKIPKTAILKRMKLNK